jgi:hypothetical protein
MYDTVRKIAANQRWVDKNQVAEVRDAARIQ